MTAHKSIALLLACIALVSTASCNRKANGSGPLSGTGSSSGRDDSLDPVYGASVGFNAALVKLDDRGFKKFVVDVRPFRTDAHRSHLADPMRFVPVPDQNLPGGKTAVVGSRVCVLYPSAKIAASDDLARLPKGIPIPFGTIIPIKGEKVENPAEKERYGMFEFQDNWNWFYRTSYNGQDGLVFGADLYGLDDDNRKNRISARLYQTGGSYDAFYPVIGYHEIPSRIADRIERDRVAIQSVQKDEYYLYKSMPDDMLALYDNHAPTNAPLYASDEKDWSRQVPLFVTTDLASHAQHLMFDRTLQYLEEAYFMPRLADLVARFLSDLREREGLAASCPEAYEKGILYFQVAEALLAIAPERVKNENDDYRAEPILYREVEVDAVLSSYPEAVRAEVAKILKAEAYTDSSVFAFKDGETAKEDYTQYRARGHYTKNGALSAYFRAMMWFGRAHFLIAAKGPDPIDGSSGAEALSLDMAPIALLVTDVVRDDSALYEKWLALFAPITALIGESDDLSFAEILPLWKDERVSKKEFGEWASKRENLVAFMEKAHDKLRPPAISGSSVFWGPSEGSGAGVADGAAASVDRKPPMGWRLFGQRFTYDSKIHDLVSPPRLMSRDMVRGLDVMKAFGSSTADSLLASSDYPVMAGLKDRLDGIEREFSGYDAGFWDKTYYNDVLFEIKAQAQFEPGAGFYFTEGPGWAKKAMLSAHGTWAELRHDTILYVKQSAAERAGDGDFEPTFRTEPIPDPVHYLEPNVPFWQGATVATQKLLCTLDAYDLLDEETAKAFGRFREICAKASDVAALEAANKPVSQDDVKWIARIPAELIHLVLVHIDGGDVIEEDQLKMALVADVYTNFELEKVLEVAIGIPYRIYVPLNDAQGGKRIAVGYSFSYYEYPHGMDDRMTDEAWKKIAYGPNASLGKYLPFWMEGVPLESEPSDKK